jgi:AcrR family transcriptional regulator
MSKGRQTRQTILKQALELSTEVGLEGLTVGVLARKVGMSKSGLYAHFASKEDLQSQVLDVAAEHFVEVVIVPALKEPRGIPRLQALFERWLDWATENLSGGCPFISAAAEFDDRSGPVRDTLVAHKHNVLETIARAIRICIQEGHISGILDVDQITFEIWGLLLAHHHYARLMHRKDARDRAVQALQRLLEQAKKDR